MSGGNIAVCSRSALTAPAALEPLRAAGYRITTAPGGAEVSRAELAALLQDADALLVGTQPIDAELLAGAPRLRIIAKTGAGVDNIDMAAARVRGITVVGTPGANAGAVADYTIGLILALVRGIAAAHSGVLAGKWPRVTGIELAGKIIGVVGLGAVGKGVARRAAAGFGMDVLAYDVCWDEPFAQQYGVRRGTLSEVLAAADIVTLHAPLLPETQHLIRAETLATMHRGAYLINAARGALIKTDDLVAALESGHLAGAALDVLEQEPPTPALLERLRPLPLVLSPHNAAYTHEALAATVTMACAAVLTTLRGGGR